MAIRQTNVLDLKWLSKRITNVTNKCNKRLEYRQTIIEQSVTKIR